VIAPIPPIEVLNIQRVTLPDSNHLVLVVVNDGPDSVTIAQVLVDDAYWTYDVTPGRTLGRLDSATVTISYPWVEGEVHTVSLLSSTDVITEKEIEVAVQTSAADRSTVARFALIGFYVGVVPVALGSGTRSCVASACAGCISSLH